MKYIFLFISVLSILIMYSGCNKDNPVAPGNNGTTTKTVTFVKTTPDVPINIGLNQDIINVDSSGNVNSLTFALDSITAITATQLEIFLVHNGIIDTLVYQLTNPGNNFIGTIFSDAAQNSISSGSGNYSGTYKPYRPLSIFNGQNINGQWTLIINSFVNDRSGVIKSWGITVTYSPLQPTSQWVQMSNGMGADRTIFSFTTLGNNIFAGSGYNHGIYLSTDYGVSWTQTALNFQWGYSLATLGNNIFAGTSGGGVYISTNNGTSWTQTPLSSFDIGAIKTLGTNIFAGTTYNGVYLSTDNGTSWSQSGLSPEIICSFTTLGNNIFAGAGTQYSSGLYLSTDNGNYWTQIGFSNQSVRALLTSGTNIFAGTTNYGVYISTNNGTNWTQTSLNNQSIRSLAISDTKLFAGTEGGGVFLSTNNGGTWTPINQGFPSIHPIYSLLVTNNYIFAGTDSLSVWRRDLNGIIDK